MVIGGGWQGNGDRERGGVEIVPDSLVGNVRLACHAIPALKAARLARAWAGLEAETARCAARRRAGPGLHGCLRLRQRPFRLHQRTLHRHAARRPHARPRA